MGLTDGEKAAIVILRTRNLSVNAICEKVGRGYAQVYEFLEEIKTIAATTGIDYDFKEDLKLKSVDAVTAGLDYQGESYDPYKRGNLGVNVLKGLGILQPEGASIYVNNLISAVPPEWNSRYVRLDDGEKPNE